LRADATAHEERAGGIVVARFIAIAGLDAYFPLGGLLTPVHEGAHVRRMHPEVEEPAARPQNPSRLRDRGRETVHIGVSERHDDHGHAGISQWQPPDPRVRTGTDNRIYVNWKQ